MFGVRNVSQWSNLKDLGEPLGGAERLLEAVSFKKATEGMGRGRVANVRWERVDVSTVTDVHSALASSVRTSVLTSKKVSK